MRAVNIIFVAVLTITVACSAPQPAAPPPVTEPITAAPVKSDAEARADALLADMAQREAAYKQQEAELAARERGRPQPQSAPAAPTTPVITAAPVASAPPPIATASAPVQFGGHDEAWWKNEMRNAEVRATDNARRLQEAMDTRSRASDQMSSATRAGAVVFAQAQEAFNRANAEVQRLQGEVRNDTAAVERVREDARRANVPPGWLRWP